MKRTILTLFAVVAIATYATAETDTLVVSHPDEVKVITTGDTLSVSISGKKDHPGYFYSKSVTVDTEQEDVTRTSKNVGSGLGWDFSLIEGSKQTPTIELSLWARLYAGWDFLLGAPAEMKLKGWKSYEAGIDIFHFTYRPRTDKWWVTLDWGLLMNRYHFKNNMMTSTADGAVYMAPYPDESYSQSSSFQTLSGCLSLMGHYRLSKNQSIGLGVTWTTQGIDGSSYKTKYTLSDGTSVTDMNEIPIRSNLFGIKAEYMFGNNIGLYARYTPMSLFDKDKAPSFQQLNVGFQVRF